MSQIRLSDYIFQTLADRGLDHVFLVTGGGAMHLNDAVAIENRIHRICCHHEQACAIAAEGYARISGKPGIVNVTTGPGGINALNGVFGAWTDSIPMLVISGQVKRETMMQTHGLIGRIRQLGDQEADIIGMVRGITKYAVTITEPETIRYHLERAIHLASNGRPGPCWIDIPVDVQAAQVDPDTMRPYNPAEDDKKVDRADLEAKAKEVLALLSSAERPILLAGTGVRLAGAEELLLRVAETLRVPIATAWTHDLIASDHPLYAGRQGTIGTRAGNFTVQNADFVLILGSRLCIRQISYNWSSFARTARTAQVDIDPAELSKPTFQADLPIEADVRDFLEILLRESGQGQPTELVQREDWLSWCRERVERNPIVLQKHRTAPLGRINQYHFIELLFSEAHDDAVFACGNATACITPFQAGVLKKGQRLFSNSGSASMGYDLPAAIGASVADPGRTVICLAGDGSLQMNVQEFATLASLKLPVKVFVLENGGYLSIRSTQRNFFGRLVGEGPESGLGFPDFVKLAEAYGLPSHLLDTENPAADISRVLNADGPQVVVVPLDLDQGFEPKTSSKRLPDGRMVTAPLEDMAPFLEREEFLSNMLVEPLKDC
ncbi:MAG: thiamine pyrophosphate-binding protein [Verrucomicrobia bacterium]|nr:thiamine pyrophosphate-binding protein [Verrucomicrobiota bacterium]